MSLTAYGVAAYASADVEHDRDQCAATLIPDVNSGRSYPRFERGSTIYASSTFVRSFASYGLQLATQTIVRLRLVYRPVRTVPKTMPMKIANGAPCNEICSLKATQYVRRQTLSGCKYPNDRK